MKDAKLKADAIKIFLKFLYSDFKDITGINDGSVWDVLYAGICFIIYTLNIFDHT